MKKINKEMLDKITEYIINSDFDNLKNIIYKLHIKGNFSKETEQMLYNIIDELKNN
ncbi:hypothetical protein [Spiroplasma endosymbiont of Polydrusus cervinus]|uniref:hypothetical protein n=1 Tax=Spiroplasma endosymbiont of Polydrusus cervinus TaxID=3066287 RepID=UPI0030D3A6DF